MLIQHAAKVCYEIRTDSLSGLSGARQRCRAKFVVQEYSRDRLGSMSKSGVQNGRVSGRRRNWRISIGVVIEQGNLERLEKGDPITLKSKTMGGLLYVIDHPDNLRVVVAFERDSGRVHEFLQPQDKIGLLQYLMSGYVFQSKDGPTSEAGMA